MAVELVTKAQLSKMGDVADSLIAFNCREGNIWHHAVDEEETNKVNIKDKVVAAWLKKKKREQHTKLKGFEALTVKEILEEYKNIPNFLDLVKTRKIIADTELKKLQLEGSRNELVSREYVGKACFGYLEMLSTRLLEMPTGRIPKITALLETGSLDAKERAVEVLVKEISKIIANVKRDIVDRLGDDFATPT